MQNCQIRGLLNYFLELQINCTIFHLFFQIKKYVPLSSTPIYLSISNQTILVTIGLCKVLNQHFLPKNIQHFFLIDIPKSGVIILNLTVLEEKDSQSLYLQDFESFYNMRTIDFKFLCLKFFSFFCNLLFHSLYCI